MYKYKDFTLSANDEQSNGKISGYASTWIREPDAYGDVVKAGAFAESLAKIDAAHKTIPLIFSHRLDDLDAYLGKVDVLREDDHGLYFEATFDDTPQAQKARQLCIDHRLTKFSFAYDTLEEGLVTLEDGRKANELRKLDIFEVSLVLIPANQDASMTDIKSDNTIDDTQQQNGKETKSGDNESTSEDQKLRNLQKFELLQRIKKYEKDKH